MDPITITIIAAKYMAYGCAVCTVALKVLPTPEDTVSIFILQVPPRHYQIFYNLLRWGSGNKSWQERPDATRSNNNG